MQSKPKHGNAALRLFLVDRMCYRFPINSKNNKMFPTEWLHSYAPLIDVYIQKTKSEQFMGNVFLRGSKYGLWSISVCCKDTKVLDRWKTWCYDTPNNFIQQMHLSKNQYIQRFWQRVVGWCKTTGTAVWNSFCEQCTEMRIVFE